MERYSADGARALLQQEHETMSRLQLRRLTRWAAATLLASALPALAQDALLARNLAATCANCHGTTGNALGDMKPLAGMSADKIIALIADYKSGAQPATIMHQIAKGYTDEQIRLVAGYFAAQTATKK
jgi:cytochrome subunit of sulfide dehydrogenase